MENTGNVDGDFADREQWAVRFDARWLAADWLIADYTYDQSELQYHNMNFQGVVPPFTSHGLADLFKSYAQTQSVYSTRRLDSLATGAPHKPSFSRADGHSLILDLPLFDAFAVKYIGAARQLTDDQYIDLGGGGGSTDYRLDTGAYDGPAAIRLTGAPTPLSVPRVFQDQTSHELQVSGRLFDDTLEFVLGGFVFEEQGGENGRPFHHILTSYLDPAAAAADPTFGPLFVGMTSPRLVAFWDYELYIRNKAEAAFVQATWSPEFLDRRLHLTAGVRQSRDEREAVKYFIQRFVGEGNTAGGGTQAFDAPAGFPPGTDDFNYERGHIRYSDLSPSYNIRYDALPDLSVYATSSRAYKSGGYNIRDPQRNADSGAASDGTDYGFGFAEGFRPEYVESLELGFKSEWFGKRLRFNADVFESDFTDMQTNFMIAGTIADTKAQNVGKARMRGLELEATFMALPGLLLTLDYAHLDADVLEMLDIDGNNVANLYPFVSAPPNSGSVGIDWSFADMGWANLRGFLNYNYLGQRDGLVIVEERRGLTALPAYGVINARLMASGVRFGDRGTLEVGLWGRNLQDAEYEVFAIDNLPHADRAVLWGEPRALGLDLIYRYY
jgi:iron complex outermembrane receptor protein